MKKIDNLFSIVGTNPQKYFENFLNYFNHFNICSSFSITNEFHILHNNEIVFKGLSEATSRQNIDMWEVFGFVVRKNKNEFIKIIQKSTPEKLFELAKTSLIQFSPNNSINKHRDTILIKLLQLVDESFVDENFVTSRTKRIDYKTIKKEIGAFEKQIYEDKLFMTIVDMIWRGN